MKIKISNKVLNCLLAAMATGILFADKFGFTPKIFAMTCAVIMIIVLIATWDKKSAVAVKIIAAVIFFVIGAARFYFVDNLPPNDISKFEGNEVNVTGIVREEPQIKIFVNDLTQLRLIIDVENPYSGAMILTSYYQAGDVVPNVRIGDEVRVGGKVKFLTNYNNPGQIDSVTRFKSDGITARMSAGKSGIIVDEVDGNIWIKFLRFVAGIREHYRESMSKVMSSEDAVAIFAMLFGGYAGLNPELVEDFQTTGIVHILSVSGSHMGLLAMATAYLCMLLKFPRWLTLALGIFVIGTYTLLSGVLPQVTRSACMGLLVFTATALQVEAMGARLLTLTALGMLIVKPLLLFDISFQLSFASTAGLMYLSGDLRNLMSKLPGWFAYPAAMTLSAQIASLPIVIWYFNQVSLSSVFANVFVMPLLEFVIVGGMLGGMVALVIPFAGKIFFVTESLIFGAGAELNRIFANLPFSTIQVPTLGFAAGFIYYLTLIFRRVEILLIAIIISLSLSLIPKSLPLSISFVDVGQGDCAVIITPHKKCLIFDTGGVREKTFDVGGRVVVPYLKHENIRAVDTIFLTHVHEDHSGGAGSIIKKMPVREIITAGEPKSEYASVFGISEKFLNNLRAGKSGEIFNIDGVEVKILYAPNVGNGNEISNVYRIRYGNVSFLITGDLVKEVETQILNEHIDVVSTVLKVGHHGSNTSSSKEFLQAVNPKCAVICAGYGNSFGHPRAEVLERLNDIHAKIYRTDIDGLIKFKTDGKKLFVEKFRNN